MKYAVDFRSIARAALSGRWAVAVITGVVASMLGAVASEGPEIKINLDESGLYTVLNIGGQEIYTTEMGWNLPFSNLLNSGLAFVLFAVLVIAVLYYFISSVVQIGYARFNIDLVDLQNEPQIGTLFAYFSYWKTTAAARFLQWLYVFLWSLLFIIPGIVAGYSYAMTGYILAEHPELTASEAIGRSKQIMYGNRFRLFCLQLSFIGWDMLCILTLGIGYLWLNPYKQAATAAFYREVSAIENTI